MIVTDFSLVGGCVLVTVQAAALLRVRENEAGGRVCDVSMAHTLLFSYLFSPVLTSTD